MLDAKTRAREVDLKERELGVENQNRDRDRSAKELDTKVDLAKGLIGSPTSAHSIARKANTIVSEVKKP